MSNLEWYVVYDWKGHCKFGLYDNLNDMYTDLMLIKNAGIEIVDWGFKLKGITLQEWLKEHSYVDWY